MDPDRLVEAADFVVGELRPLTGADWAARAGDLDWDVRTTIAHLGGALTKTALYLAAQATRWSPLILSAHPEEENENLLDGVTIGAQALASVASSSPPGALAFHASGMHTATEVVAHLCAEILVHGWDAGRGLGIDLQPPSALCAEIVRVAHPEADPADDPWRVILDANGRLGRPAWGQWDGQAVAWDRDEATGEWVPTYPDD